MQNDITDVEATFSCLGVLIVYAPGEGNCDWGRNCPAYDLRWKDHDAYLAAHQRRARPGEQAPLVKLSHDRFSSNRATTAFGENQTASAERFG